MVPIRASVQLKEWMVFRLILPRILEIFIRSLARGIVQLATEIPLTIPPGTLVICRITNHLQFVPPNEIFISPGMSPLLRPSGQQQQQQ